MDEMLSAGAPSTGAQSFPLHLQIGLLHESSRVPVTLDTPVVIRTTGASADERRRCLIDLARQSIHAGAGLIYIDACNDRVAWNDLAAAANQRRRLRECYAQAHSVGGPWPRDIRLCHVPWQVAVNEGAIVWHGLSKVGMSALEAQRAACRLLADIDSAFAGRKPESPAVMLVLDGVLAMIEHVPAALARIVASATAKNITLIISDHDGVPVNLSALAGIDCGLFHPCHHPEALRLFTVAGGGGAANADALTTLPAGMAKYCRFGVAPSCAQTLIVEPEAIKGAERNYLPANAMDNACR